MSIDLSNSISEAKPDAEPITSYGEKSVRGSIITTATTAICAVVNFGTQIILSWQLEPADFGLLAIALSITGVIGVLRDSGAAQILIQKQNEFQRIASTVFWMTIASASLCALITLAVAPVVAHLKGNPALIPVLMLMSLRILVSSAGTVSSTRLSIDMRWGTIALINFGWCILGATSTLLLAWQRFGIYSLIVGPMVADAFRSWVTWMLAGKTILTSPKWNEIWSLAASSATILATNITIAIRGYGDYVTLSVLTNEYITGLYFFAFVLSAGLSRMATVGFSVVLAPVFARVGNDPARQQGILTQSLHAYALVGTVPMVLQICLAAPFFRLVISSKWETAAVMFATLAILNGFRFFNSAMAQLLSARGCFREVLVFALCFLPIEICLFVVGTLLGQAQGLAVLGAVSGILDFILFHWVGCRVLKIPLRPLLEPLWRLLLATVPTFLVAVLVSRFTSVGKLRDVLFLCGLTLFCTITYIAILRLVWPDLIQTMWQTLRRALKLA